MYPAPDSAVTTLINNVLRVMQDEESIRTRAPVGIQDVNGVEIGARHCYRGESYSGGLVVWVDLPAIEGYYRHYSQRHTFEVRFKPGHPWWPVQEKIERMYHDAYRRWGTILTKLEHERSLAHRLLALSAEQHTSFLAWVDVAVGEGRNDIYEDMTDDDYAYWHLICAQVEADHA